MNIFVLTFLGWYQYQTFTLFLGAVKRNWNISWLCFERSWLWNFPDKCQVVNFWHKVKSEDQDHWQYYGQEIWKENLLLFVDIWSIVDFHIYWGFVWSYFPPVEVIGWRPVEKERSLQFLLKKKILVFRESKWELLQSNPLSEGPYMFDRTGI